MSIKQHKAGRPLSAHLMFHPRGPNLRRSCTTAWKKERLNSSFFHAVGLAWQDSNGMSVMSL